MVANQINRTEAVKKENIIKKQEESQNSDIDTSENNFADDNENTTSVDEITTETLEETSTADSEITEAAVEKSTSENTTEVITDKDNKSNKKGGFFSRFKKKKK